MLELQGLEKATSATPQPPGNNIYLEFSIINQKIYFTFRGLCQSSTCLLQFFALQIYANFIWREKREIVELRFYIS
jgi:hypothetical protein